MPCAMLRAAVAVRRCSVLKTRFQTIAASLGCCMLALVCGSGCKSLDRQKPNSSSTNAAPSLETRNNAASLLFNLLGDEKNVGKLLLIKRERRELHDVIKRVSDT